MSAHARRRTKPEKIAHLERSINKFGDSDGKRAEALARLTGRTSRDQDKKGEGR